MLFKLQQFDAVLQVCNNLALAIQMASIAEAAALGGRLGMDSKLLADIFNSSSARCWTSDTYHPVPVRAHATLTLCLMSCRQAIISNLYPFLEEC